MEGGKMKVEVYDFITPMQQIDELKVNLKQIVDESNEKWRIKMLKSKYICKGIYMFIIFTILNNCVVHSPIFKIVNSLIIGWCIGSYCYSSYFIEKDNGRLI